MHVPLSHPWTEGDTLAQHLERTDDGTVALVVPAAAFSVYTWGNTKDDIMQGIAESPWAVRNVIPLAQPGNPTIRPVSPATR